MSTSAGNAGRGNVFVDTGAVIECEGLTAYLEHGCNVFLNGTITCTHACDVLNVRVMYGNVHVGLKGIVGNDDPSNHKAGTNKGGRRKKKQLRECKSSKASPKAPKQNSNIDKSCGQEAKVNSWPKKHTKTQTNTLYFEIINGNLTNFGRISAINYLLLICDNLMLCENSEFDSAARGFKSYIALQKEYGYLSSDNVQENPKQNSSFNDSRLLPTVRSLDSKSFVSLLNEEIDPTVDVGDRSIHDAFNNIRGQGDGATYDKLKVEKELIRGSLNTWKWQHGVISSSSMKCIVKKDINDCSQLQCDQLVLQVNGSALVVKPWTWNCGHISGFVKEDLLFHDNAVLTKLNKFHVFGNFRIFRTSFLYIPEGGELTIVGEFENNSALISDKNFSLAVGYLKQARESSITSNEDLLVSLYKAFDNLWFGYIYAHRHLYVQLQEKVVCDAFCVAEEEVHVEFFGESPQLVVTHVLLTQEGSLHMQAENECETDCANLVVSGKLVSRGIQAETASLHIVREGLAELVCKAEMEDVDVITRWLNISNQAVMISRKEQNKTSELIKSSTLRTHVYCDKSLFVEGILQAYGSDLNIYSEAIQNRGTVKLSEIDSSSSSLSLECDKEIFNSGIIESEGNLEIDAMLVCNEDGVIKSSSNLTIHTNDLGATTLCGQIVVDRRLNVYSNSERELFFRVVGGRSENNRHFIPPNQLEVECKKAHLYIDCSMLCSEVHREGSDESEGSEMIFSLHESLSFKKECVLQDVSVQYAPNEKGNNNESHQQFIIQDSLKVNSLYLSSDTATKSNILFEGANKSTVIGSLEVDKKIHEVVLGTENLLVCTEALAYCDVLTIKTHVECVHVHANNLNVRGRMVCLGRNSKEKKSLVNVNNTFTVEGIVDSAGSTQIFVGDSFLQRKDGNIRVEGTLLLKIVNKTGRLCLEGSTEGEKESVMTIEGDNIDVSGCLSGIKTLSLEAEIEMTLSTNGRISCENIDVKGEWVTATGTIEGFHTLRVQPWAIVNSGIIDSEIESSSVFFQSDLTLVNSGVCRAQTTYLEAPFLLSLPGRTISDVNEVKNCQLVGKELLKLESIACFLGGSSYFSYKRLENISVLLFKFLTYGACSLDPMSIEAWSKAAASLRNIQSQMTSDVAKQDSRKLKTLMNSKDLVTGTVVEMKIDRMYGMVNEFVGEILKNGIKSFDATKLVHILTIESERYARLNALKQSLLQIPEKAKKMRDLLKRGKIKLKKSVRKKFGFSDPKMQGQEKDGIFESAVYAFAEDVTISDALYEAAFEEVFCNEGFIFAVDMLASAKEVVLSKREKKAVAMVIYSENLNMENVDADYVHVTADDAKISDVDAKTVDVNASRSIEAITVTSDQLHMKAGNSVKAKHVSAQNTFTTGKHVNLKDIKSTTLNAEASKTADVKDVQAVNVDVQAKEITAADVDCNTAELNAANNACIKNINADHLNVKSSQSIAAENIKAGKVEMESNYIDVSTLDANNTNLTATTNASVKNVKSDNLQVQATGTIYADNVKGTHVNMKGETVKASDIKSDVTVLSGKKKVEAGNIESKTVSMESSEGEVKATGKVKSGFAKIYGKKGIDMAYSKSGNLTAEHQFQSLHMETNKISEINKLLQGDGIYKDLKVADQLGLIVSDQDVIFSRCVVKQSYKLDLKAKSVNIDNASLNWDKGVSITSDQTMNVHNASLVSEKSVLLKSNSGNVNLRSADVKAGEIAGIEASKGSISVTGASISGDQAAILKSKKGITVDPIVHNHSNSSKRDGFFSSSKTSSSFSTVQKSRISSGRGIVSMETEGDIKITAADINAEKGVSMTADDIKIQDKKLYVKKLVLKRTGFVQRERYVELRKPISHQSILEVQFV